MKKIGIVSALLCVLLLLSGCFVKSAGELYTLPEQSEEYYSLHTAISEIMTDDMQYASPVSGSYQQPVQMADLNGDGVDEAIVFLKSTGSKPLKIYIFACDRDTYENVCVIEGDGSAFSRVEYAQIDDHEGVELVVGRQISTDVLQSVTAYHLSEGQPVELMSANYSEFTIVDLDDDGKRDLFVLRFDTEEAKSVVELYRYGNGTMEREQEAALSAGVTSVRHIVSGNLSAESKAVFVGGVTEAGVVITDVFGFFHGSFGCLSSMEDFGLSAAPIRGYNVFAVDVDEDGNLELPDVVRLFDPSAAENEEPYSAIRWYGYDPDSGLLLKMVTYHNFAGGWFLEMPDSVGTHFAIARGNSVDGVNGLVFSTANRGIVGDELFTVYAFTGNRRNEIAAEDGRIVLCTKGETVYAAALSEGAQRLGLDTEELSSLFRFIRVDWNSGET